MLCLLGPPAVRVGDELTPLRLRPKAVAVLARVALEGAVSRAELADLVFPDAESPRAALRWHLSYLREQLPEPIRAHLTVTSEHVALDVSTDVAVFQAYSKGLVEQPDTPQATSVLGLYRGDLCSGLTVSASANFDTWLYLQQEDLRRAFRQATVAVARHVLATGHGASVLESLAKLVTVDPYFEEGHVLLIEACEAVGLPAAAKGAFERYQRILREELQADPPRALIDRYEPGSPAGRIPPRDELVSLSRLTLHVLDWGGGEPAILAIHGSTMSAHTFTALAESLAPEIRFIAVDLRGHGFSDKPPNGYSIDDHVDDLCELVSVLRLHRPVVLGFSMGGAIAAFLAGRLETSGLLLLDGVIGDRAFTENAAALVVPPQRATLELRVGGFGEYLSRWRATMMTGGWSDEAERVLERTIRYELAPLGDGTYRRRTLTAAFEETWASLIRSDGLAALRKIRCPTLIVHATRPWIDGRPYLTDPIVAAQRSAVPHAALFVARHSMHPMLARAPEPEMVARIKEFVRSLQHPLAR
jgi:pimeloyl-ACP methyl ester carboxylesterase/DNA-binding SARP family transcriptional activator